MAFFFAIVWLYGIGLLTLWFFALLLRHVSASHAWRAIVWGSAAAVALTPVFATRGGGDFAGPYLFAAFVFPVMGAPVPDAAAWWLGVGLPFWIAGARYFLWRESRRR
ncbi:MAG: hypothetical protein U0230_24260 [Polyangiales bacterium]